METRQIKLGVNRLDTLVNIYHIAVRARQRVL